MPLDRQNCQSNLKEIIYFSRLLSAIVIATLIESSSVQAKKGGQPARNPWRSEICEIEKERGELELADHQHTITSLTNCWNSSTSFPPIPPKLPIDFFQFCATELLGNVLRCNKLQCRCDRDERKKPDVCNFRHGDTPYRITPMTLQHQSEDCCHPFLQMLATVAAWREQNAKCPELRQNSGPQRHPGQRPSS